MKQWIEVACLAVVMGLFSGGCFAEEAKPDPGKGNGAPIVDRISSLTQAANAVMQKKDTVEIRKDIGVVLDLVDELAKTGSDTEVLRYLTFALEHYPWSLKHQMIYARLLDKSGDKKTAKERAELVLKFAETDTLVEEARSFLGLPAAPVLPALSKVEGTSNTLVIVALGSIDRILLQDIRSSLEPILGIPVVVQTVDLKMPPAGRDLYENFLKALRKDVEAFFASDRPEDKKVRKDNQWTTESIRTEEGLLSVYRTLLAKGGGPDGVQRLDNAVATMKVAGQQWDVEPLIMLLAEAVKPMRRAGVKYLGIMNQDIYGGESNFLFGMAKPAAGCGVMSYRRFMADFNQETPSRDRLRSRAVKQCLSSAGFLFGVPRCTDPTCARAYPNNLAEHDAKAEKLCAACNKNLEIALAAQTMAVKQKME